VFSIIEQEVQFGAGAVSRHLDAFVFLMSNNTEQGITDNVLQAFAGTPDPRLKAIMTALVKHLHSFIREVELTEGEWWQAIQFLTRAGHITDDKRQEFILLSDTLGVTMLVDAINHRKGDGATENTIFGPFYRDGAQELPYGGSIIHKKTYGEVCVASGRVLSTGGRPIANALLDVWETNEDGFYDSQLPDGEAFNLRGRFRSREDGSYKFVGIKPVPYPIPYDGPVGGMLKATNRSEYRPAHIHVMVSADGYEPVTTHIFVKGDPYLETDAVFGTKDSLVADFVSSNDPTEAARHGVSAPFCTVNFDFVLKPLSK
jgi:protocatechuate 3,4-dioxygenase beta subunit